MQIYANGNSKPHTASPNKYPQGCFKDKACKWCTKLFAPQAPSHHLCSDECRDNRSMDRYLQRTYGITYADYYALDAKSDSTCYMCGSKGFKINPNAKTLLCVDHCHTSGEVRGLLCHNCNRALGLLKDNIDVMRAGIEYLEGATTIPKGSTPK